MDSKITFRDLGNGYVRCEGTGTVRLGDYMLNPGDVFRRRVDGNCDIWTNTPYDVKTSELPTDLRDLNTKRIYEHVLAEQLAEKLEQRSFDGKRDVITI